ncbi:MAG: hypothetical protein QXO70_04685 [Candidatus Pacearchaeota archaeon]
MLYSTLVETYKKLEATSSGLEKTSIISQFLDKIKGEPEVIYLLLGRVFPDYDERELGISEQLAIKALAKASGISEEAVVKKFKSLGDLGLIAYELVEKKKQATLFVKRITTEKVLENLRKLPELVGKGTIEKKLNLVIELLNSASPDEAKYLIRTILGDLKIGVGAGILRDAIVNYCFKPKNIEEKKSFGEKVQNAYDKSTDFAEVFEKACKNKLEEISLSPGKPVKVMLFPKVESIEEAFEVVGRPAGFEFKYDGFRMMINKDEKGEIKIFTRRLDNVTKQFPDAIKYVKENVNAKTFIIDGEAVGYNPKTKNYLPFQAIYQEFQAYFPQ